MDWILTALSVWLVGGFYVDIWAHAHGRVDNTFFTPWHAFLYSGAASFGVVLGVAAIMGRPRSVPIRDTLAPPTGSRSSARSYSRLRVSSISLGTRSSASR